MKANEKTLALIKKWEGYHEKLANDNARAYPDPAHGWGVPTIGYGSTRNMDTGEAVKRGDVITRETAERWLRIEADQCCASMVTRYPTCNENQIGALVSLTYNIGRDGIGDGLHDLLVAREWSKAADKLLEYCRANGQVMEGLLNRRRDERALFLTPVEAAPNPQPVPADDRVTWLEYHRLEEGGVSRVGCVGYAGPDALVTWDGTDKSSLMQFMARFKNAATVQVAPASKAWPTAKPPAPVQPFLKLQRTGQVEEKGCEVLLLTLEGTNRSWFVRSGQPHAQVFQHGGPQNQPGSMMPLPGGEYRVEDIQWAGGIKDNWDGNLGAGLGPLFVPVEPQFQTKRGEFGIHLDTGAYGTAGCIGLKTVDNLKVLVEMLRQYDPRRLVVSW